MATSDMKKSTAALLSKKELLKIIVNDKVNELLPGEWPGKQPGSGYDFDSLREMQPGDLSGRIDWPARARTGKLYVREFFAESHYNLMLVYDLSASMNWGRKTRLADNIAVALARSAITTNNACGLLLWAEGPVFYLPPRSSREHFVALVNALAQHQPLPKTSFALQAAMDYLKKLPFQSLAFILSDFLDPLNEADLITRRHEVKALQIIAAVEKELPAELSGILSCRDPETGTAYQLDLGKWRDYNRRMAERQEKIKQKFLRAGVAAASITPTDNFVPIINRLLALAPRPVNLYQT